MALNIFTIFFLILTSFYLLILGVEGYCCTRSLTMTLTLGRTYLDEGSPRRRRLYLKTDNTNKRQSYMPAAEFEPAIPEGRIPTPLSAWLPGSTVLSLKCMILHLQTLYTQANIAVISHVSDS